MKKEHHVFLLTNALVSENSGESDDQVDGVALFLAAQMSIPAFQTSVIPVFVKSVDCFHIEGRQFQTGCTGVPGHGNI